MKLKTISNSAQWRMYADAHGQGKLYDALYAYRVTPSWVSLHLAVIWNRQHCLQTANMAPHPMTEAEIDEERKTELIMEKKLRACRVNIIPRVGKLIKRI